MAAKRKAAKPATVTKYIMYRYRSVSSAEDLSEGEEVIVFDSIEDIENAIYDYYDIEEGAEIYKVQISRLPTHEVVTALKVEEK